MVSYAVAPRDASGGECFHPDIEKAHLFKEDGYLSYTNQTISGNDRYGDFAYKQELLEVNLTVK